MKTPLGLSAWRLLTTLATPLAPLLLRQRAARGKEETARMAERLGNASLPRPQGRLTWIHGASVGESLAALPLIERLLAEPDTHVLMTSGTVSSATLLKRRLPDGAVHQYVPLDTPGAVARFLDHWKPDAGLFVMSELWPNLVMMAHERGIPLGLVNGRISESSAARWAIARKSIANLLRAFDLVLAEDERVAARFRALGAQDVRVVGSLKADAPPLSTDEAALTKMREAIGARPILLAAQTHPGEDETILPAHDVLRERFGDLLTIIVPRHIERADDIQMLCSGRASARRSRNELPSPQTAIYIADTLGELGLFYRLAPFCFLGATLVPLGGHNPLEPAVLRCAILAGPHHANNPVAFDAVLSAQGFGAIASSADIAREAARLISNPAAAAAAGAAAAQGASSLSGAVARTTDALKSLLDAHA
jgi:3-deoxy-D-manno-octulosonic-acid transferase